MVRPHSRLTANLSTPLPTPRLDSAIEPHSQPPSYLAFQSTLVAVSAILKDLNLQTDTLPESTTYRELTRFFGQHLHALGVLITAEAPPTEGRSPLAVISRSQLLQWRSQRQIWRTVLDQPLTHYQPWWQSASHYLLIDHQMPLKDAIDQILECRDQAYNPLAIQTSEGFSLVDPQALLMAYTRLSRLEQATLADLEVENLRRQHQLILNAIGEGVYGVDLQGNATFVNPAATQMIGWDAQDLIGKSMHQLLHHSRPDRSPYPRAECPIYAAFQDGIIHRVSEEVFWRKDGTSFPVEYISTPMRDEQGNLIGAVIAFRDITQRKWAESILHRANEELEQRVRDRTRELQQANEQLKELSELRSRVVTTVCHEFRNPLNNISLSVSSLGRYNTQLTPEHKEKYLLGIQENVERMTQMIDAILIIGQVEARGMEIKPSTFDIIQFCQALVSELQLGESGDRIQITTRSKQLSVTLDPSLLRSILLNLLSNALRYSADPSPVHLHISKQKKLVLFQISDRGIGIPPEDLPHLFEPFHRGRNVSNIAGTGLGLNIVKRFVSLHGGQITVDSTIGVGTTFLVSLPQHSSPSTCENSLSLRQSQE